MSNLLIALAMALLAGGQLASAAKPRLYTSHYLTVPSGMVKEYLASLGEMIKRFNTSPFFIDVATKETQSNGNEFASRLVDCDEEGFCKIQITASNYASSPHEIQRRMRLKLFEQDAINAYHVIASAESTNELNESIDRTDLYEGGLEFFAGSKFIELWAYRRSLGDGPNCFHSALAVLGEVALTPEFISAQDFERRLHTRFDEIPLPTSFGDVAIFKDNGGELRHAASFVGVDQDNSLIFFTKNGRRAGAYLFMSLHDLSTHDLAYPDTDVRFYRLKRNNVPALLSPSNEAAFPLDPANIPSLRSSNLLCDH